MTLSPLLIKTVLATAVVGTLGTAASFKIYQTSIASRDAAGKTSESDKPSTPLTPDEEILALTTNPVVLVKANTNLTSSPKLSVDSTDHNFKCKVSGDDAATDFCRLVKLDLSKNWIDVNGIKKATSSGTVKLTDLNSADNHFKLEINQALYAKVNLSEKKHIEIISTTTANKKLAKLNVSFKVSDAEIDYVSTKHLLGRLETAPASIDSLTKHQCFWTTSTTADSTKACSIFSFGSAQTTFSGARYHRQTVTNLLTPVSIGDLTKHNSFVIEHKTQLTKAAIVANKTLYVKKLDTNTLSGDGKLENLVPVIIEGTNKKVFILSETPSYSIIVKKSAALVSSKTISHTNSTKNYKCKVSSIDFDCDLVDLDLSDTKTSLTIAAIKDLDLTTDLSLPHTETKTQFFKLDVPLAQFETIKTNLISAPTPTAVELVEITDGTTKIGDLTPIFAIDDDNVPYFQKSTFLVKNAVISGHDMSGKGAIDTSKTRHCSFSSPGTTSTTTTKCELIDLGSGELTATTAITDAATTGPLVNTKNYLVKFIGSSNAEATLPKGSKDANNLFFVEGGVDGSNKKLVAKFANEHIQPALVVDGDGSKKHLFILS